MCERDNERWRPTFGAFEKWSMVKVLEHLTPFCNRMGSYVGGLSRGHAQTSVQGRNGPTQFPQEIPLGCLKALIITSKERSEISVFSNQGPSMWTQILYRPYRMETNMEHPIHPVAVAISREPDSSIG